MSRRRVLAFALTASMVVLLDQFTKELVRRSLALGESVPVIDGVLWLTRVRNTGAAFGLLRGWQWLLVAIALVVLGAVAWALVRLKPESGVARTAFALITGGAIGNLIDRVVSGGVTDFFDLGWFPVFNVADIALDVGVALLIVWLLFGSEHRSVIDDGTGGVRTSEGGAGDAGVVG